jgi:glycogen synthase|tara:strand:- start:376 stop:627 length:252 start_codon:yes stop_codon:yes gene_type:complete
MNRNCIPIVNKVGGNSEVVINNINGYIFKMDDLKKTSSIIYKILKNNDIDQNIVKESINKKFSSKKFNNKFGKYLNKLHFNYE